MTDAIVLGGGLYGIKTALKLRALGLSVILMEPNGLMQAATRVNQNRVHAGFHYPRSVATAETAARHYRRFLIEHAEAISGQRRHLYCLAIDSKVGPEKYEEVLDTIGAEYLKVATPDYFAPGMIAQAYETQEKSFNIQVLREMLATRLDVGGVGVVEDRALYVYPHEGYVLVQSNSGPFHARYVFNCTYVNLDLVVPIRTPLVKEWAEVPIIEFPKDTPAKRTLQDNITIMDGPYFSLMRYPPKLMGWALTHVKYGRHPAWIHDSERAFQMIADAARFIPVLQDVEVVDRMITRRVLLAETKDDDGRPVLIEYAEQTPRIISILGSKFNSIYEVEEFLDKWVQHAF